MYYSAIHLAWSHKGQSRGKNRGHALSAIPHAEERNL